MTRRRGWKPTPEQSERISAAGKRAWAERTPEQRAERARKGWASMTPEARASRAAKSGYRTGAAGSAGGAAMARKLNSKKNHQPEGGSPTTGA